MALRTDMAMELCKGVRVKRGKIERTDVELDEALAARYKKAAGKYVTLESDAVVSGDRDMYRRLARAIGEAMKEMSGEVSNVLVVGLGNPKLTADSLGSRVFDRLVVTRFHDYEGTQISGICPNVLGVTGIESFDVIKGVVDRICPELVIAVDSLASASTGRIATAFQLCSSGITPGSGVSNHRMRLSCDSLGCKVISLGVPLVVYAGTIINEAVGETEVDDKISGLIVTPKDIDMLVEECAFVLAEAINSTYLSRT